MTAPNKTPKPSAHDRLLGAAMALFYNHGINGTGIDAIVERAGVAKKSLYNNFSSKADLVNQYLKARHGEWLGLYETRAAAAQTPNQRILAVFDAYQDHAEFAYERGFRGCGLLNAAAELETADIGRAAVRRHKEQVESILAHHLSDLLPNQPDRVVNLAAMIAFLLEGAMVRAGLEGSSARVITARAMVYDMLEGL
ncbi:TetR family transcriptional regulator [Thioclava sp. SK-1]|uniref:TetR/AcrR family transcriptional regulator n=1 Tax=Thioclava sp. SK-1 TaxID=1889770 RepID=UPI00082590F0|nr:TetR/AcrR family transcriptional regulator [Thioclava sp. SK-1]OCX64542.1 TetR family transcriptional regulator [Thioclava sp. SK-1]